MKRLILKKYIHSKPCKKNNISLKKTFHLFQQNFFNNNCFFSGVCYFAHLGCLKDFHNVKFQANTTEDCDKITEDLFTTTIASTETKSIEMIF